MNCPEPGHRRRGDPARLRDENDEMRQILCALCLHADGHTDPFIRELAERAAKCGGASSDFRRLREGSDA